MITYFYDGKTYHQGEMQFDEFEGSATVTIGNICLSCGYLTPRHHTYSDEKSLRDNIEERLRNRRMKSETA